MGSKELTPADLRGQSLQGMFGMTEYETAIAQIVDYLADDDQCLKHWNDWPALHDTGWKKLFAMASISSISPMLFAMLCADGWIECCHFPKYTFRLHPKAIARIQEKYR